MDEVSDQVTTPGQQLGRYRRQTGQRQEDIVAAARIHGLAWTKSIVTNIEAGRREISMAEGLLLPLIYGAPLPDLLFAEEVAVELVPGVRIRRAAIERLLAEASTRSRRPVVSELTAGGHLILDAQNRPVSEVDRRMAKQLDIHPQRVANLAYEQFQRSLIEERDARVEAALAHGDDPNEDRLRGLRGRVTRQLADELRPTAGLLENGDGNDQ